MEYEAVYERIGRMAPMYDAFLALCGYRNGVRRFIQELHRKTGDDVHDILDAGCGTGIYAIAALQEFPHAHVTAFDREASLVKRTRINAERKGVADRLHTFVGDITKPLPLAPNSFDVAIVSGVLEHVEPAIALPIVTAHVKKDGTILHSPVINRGIKSKILEHLYRFRARPAKEHMEAFTNLGFTLMHELHLPKFHPASYKEAYYFQKAQEEQTAVV